MLDTFSVSVVSSHKPASSQTPEAAGILPETDRRSFPLPPCRCRSRLPAGMQPGARDLRQAGRVQVSPTPPRSAVGRLRRGGLCACGGGATALVAVFSPPPTCGRGLPHPSAIVLLPVPNTDSEARCYASSSTPDPPIPVCCPHLLFLSSSLLWLPPASLAGWIHSGGTQKSSQPLQFCSFALKFRKSPPKNSRDRWSLP